MPQSDTNQDKESCESVMSTTTVSTKASRHSSLMSGSQKSKISSVTTSKNSTASSAHSKSTSIIRQQLSTLEEKLEAERRGREEAQRDLQRTVEELKAMEKMLGLGS